MCYFSLQKYIIPNINKDARTAKKSKQGLEKNEKNFKFYKMVLPKTSHEFSNENSVNKLTLSSSSRKEEALQNLWEISSFSPQLNLLAR